jgi:hypothetical protein
MTIFSPSTGSEADWNAAYYRLEDYLRALRIVNKVHQSQIILRLLQLAAARHARDPAQNPTVLAMQEARATMDQWFETLLGPRERIGVVGLISLLVVDAPVKWPAAFLSDADFPEFRRAMRESDVRAGPDLQVSSMVPRPIDVTPLLDPIQRVGALGKDRPGLNVAAAVIIFTAFSVSLLWFIF